MSVAGYLGPGERRLLSEWEKEELGQLRGEAHGRADEFYRDVSEYDPVLAGHCRLQGALEPTPKKKA